MTEQMAIETLEDLQRLLTNYRHISKELTEANGMAIQALEERAQYKAIGTIEELQALKENKERIDRTAKKLDEIALSLRCMGAKEFAECLKIQLSELEEKGNVYSSKAYEIVISLINKTVEIMKE